MAEPSDTVRHHLVALPFPGRGHINPMLNLCNLISLRRPSFLITLIVTDEWLTLIHPKPSNIQFATVPNVIPSEFNRAADWPGFIHATLTKLEPPVEQLLRRIELDVPISVIVYDTYLTWVVDLAGRMNVPVASLFTMSATVFSLSYHYDLLVENRHAGDQFAGNDDELVDYVPGVSPIRVGDLVSGINGKGKEVWQPVVSPAISMATKALFLLFVSVYELESRVIDALRSELSVPVYAVRPAIPYFDLDDTQNDKNDENTPDYVKWLDGQPSGSVLYISQGSFLSVSDAQLEEIIAGVQGSGVRYMWIAREDNARFSSVNDENGLVVPWCDQLRVLCHDAIGGFWSHCGWNSTKEGAFSGVPMLTFPIFWDQVPNSKMIVEDWKTGKRVLSEEGILITREEISKLVRDVMDPESVEGKAMRERAKEVKKICRNAVAESGSAQIDIDSFIDDITKSRTSD